MSRRWLRTTAICSFALAQTADWAQGASGAPSGAGPYMATPQRPTFTADISTTAPGTIELEFGAAASGRFLSLPTNVKYTPDVKRGLLHRGEFSVGFDGVSSVSPAGNRVTQFGDQIGVVFRRPVCSGRSFSLAVAPRAALFLRGASGARVGLRMLGAYGFGRNAVVGNVTWTAATAPSPANPAHLYEIAGDIGRVLGGRGPLNRLAVLGGAQYMKSPGLEAEVNLEEGLSYRVRPNCVLDFAVWERGLAAGPREIRILSGLTLNLGRL